MIPAFGENYPYTNFHDLNLDWIVRELKKVSEQITEKIKIADPIQWDITTQYPQYTIVVNDNIAYISEKNVPAGIDITDTDYWQPIFDFTQIHIELGELEEAIATETTNREEADTALGGRITDEATARENADTALGGRITDEATARENADTALGGRITDEATARANADTAIRNSMVKNNSVKHLLFCGDSYTAYYSGLLYTEFVNKVGIPAAQCHNLAISGAAFTPGFVASFIEQVQNYSGNRDEITDILVVGGINDALIDYGSYTTSYPDTSTTANAMATFIQYCHTNYPNAVVHLAYVGGCMATSSYYTTLHPARSQEMALFLYTTAARSMGYDVLYCYDTIHMDTGYYSSDKLHPSEDGAKAIAYTVAEAFNGRTPAETRPVITTAVNTYTTTSTGITCPIDVSFKNGVCSITFDGGFVYLKANTTLGTSGNTIIGLLSGTCPCIKSEVRFNHMVILGNFYKNTVGGTTVSNKEVNAEFIIKDGQIMVNVYDIEGSSYNSFIATGTDSTITFKGFTITVPTFNVN